VDTFVVAVDPAIQQAVIAASREVTGFLRLGIDWRRDRAMSLDGMARPKGRA